MRGAIRWHRCGGLRRSWPGAGTGSAPTVGDLLREESFSLQANAKTLEGRQHPDRDAPFRYLNEQAHEHGDTGQPVISVDAKKKELVGGFKNGGRQWRPAGDPAAVSVDPSRRPPPAPD